MIKSLRPVAFPNHLPLSTPSASHPSMPVHLTPAERRRIDNLVRGKKRTATDAMGAINTARTRRGVETTSLSTVSRYCQGLTHRRDCP